MAKNDGELGMSVEPTFRQVYLCSSGRQSGRQCGDTQLQLIKMVRNDFDNLEGKRLFLFRATHAGFPIALYASIMVEVEDTRDFRDSAPAGRQPQK